MKKLWRFLVSLSTLLQVRGKSTVKARFDLGRSPFANFDTPTGVQGSEF
jgi:hypothetical protein